MSDGKRPYRRRKFLINPKFQFTMIGFNVGLAVLAIGFIYIQNQYLFSKFTGAEDMDLAADPLIAEMIAAEQFKMNVVFGITSLVVILLLVVGGLILSHRIAGPIYRIRKHMSDIADGKNPSEVTFREKDFFPELAEAFNDFYKRIK